MVATSRRNRASILTASRKTQLFAAAIIWSLGGVALTISGTLRLSRADTSLLIPILIGAAIIAFIKGRYALLPFVRGAVARIRQRGDDSPFFGLFAPKTWALIALMILLGRMLDLLNIPPDLRGGVQIAIGLGLLATSLPFWAGSRFDHAS